MILGHSDWTPERKIGPGPYFPWQTFAKASEQKGIEHNFGFYSFEKRTADPEIIISYKDKQKQRTEDIEFVQKQLEKLGYKVLKDAGENLGKLDSQTTSAMLAFKLHYMNQDILADGFLKGQWEELWKKSSNTEAREAIAQWNENDQTVLGDILDQFSEG
ncbi:MAG: hypothetical protein LN568_06860 [Rickettsia endosymbiont of Pseudomimeciton antennatum]|nr:hypothetical protein [Rickettsia endosymbiont of Pseudomimeciton antennatum]